MKITTDFGDDPFQGLLTKSEIKEDGKENPYFVTSVDLKNYFRFKKIQYPDLELKEVEPFEYEDQTLLYVLNYNKGWEVISADKRTQVVLGCGEEGSFTMKDYEETPWGTWVYTLAMDVHIHEKSIYIRTNGIGMKEF